jgi:hypothetical protein
MVKTSEESRALIGWRPQHNRDAVPAFSRRRWLAGVAHDMKAVRFSTRTG